MATSLTQPYPTVPTVQPQNFGGAPQSSTLPTSQPQTAQSAATTPGLIDGVSNAQFKGVDGVFRTVQSNELVSDQLTGILDQNSPLMQQARTTALEQMQERGLVNSAMAQSAGQQAVIKEARPIAEGNAAAYGKAASENQFFGNQTQQFNAEAFNKNSQFNANASNQMGLQNAADKANMARVVVQDTGATTRQNSVNATNIQTTQMTNDTSVKTTGMNNATDITTTGMKEAGATERQNSVNTTSMRNTDVQEAGANYRTEQNNKTQISVANIGSETTKYVANVDSITRQSIAAASNATQVWITDKNNTQSNTNNIRTSATTIVNNASNSVLDVLKDPKIPPDQIPALLERITTDADAGLDIIGSFKGLR